MATENKITFKYKYPDDYNPQYINGAQGGINVQGEIVANFYFERLPLPNSITQEINNDGITGNVVATEPEDLPDSILRYVQSGIIMNIEVAKQVHEWLGKHIELLENQKQEKNE
jgi:hypothetical protein